MTTSSDPRDLVVMVGFGQYLLGQLSRSAAPGSIIVVEDPDIIDKREVRIKLQDLPVVGELVPGAYFHPEDDLAFADAIDGSRVRAVVPGLEYGVRTAAALAERWGLPGAGPVAAAALSDKLELRRLTSHLPMSSLDWREAFGPEDAAAALRDTGGRVVLKPANRHASLGVQILEGPTGLDQAWERTLNALDDLMLPNRSLPWRYVVEEFVEGTEFSTEALVVDGRVTFLNITLKEKATGPYPVELGHTVPAPVETALHERFAEAVAAMVDAISMGHGIVHAEWLVSDRGLVLVECAGRIPGDAIVTLIDVAYGFDLTASMMDVLAGADPQLPRVAQAGTAVRFITSRPGTVASVMGVHEVRDHVGVLDVGITCSPGTEVGDLRSSWDRVGHILTMGLTATVAAERAERALGSIVISLKGHQDV